MQTGSKAHASFYSVRSRGGGGVLATERNGRGVKLVMQLESTFKNGWNYIYTSCAFLACVEANCHIWCLLNVTEFTVLDVLMPVVMESAVFLEVCRCRLIYICGHLNGNCSLRLHGEDRGSGVSKYEEYRRPLNIY